MSPADSVAEYRLEYDDGYYQSLDAKQRPVVHAFRWLPAVLITFSILLFVSMGAIAIADGDWMTVAVPGTVFAGYLYYLKKRTPRDLARFRSSSDYGEEVEIRVAPDGVEIAGSKSTTRFRWSTFEECAARPDGLHLIGGEGSLLWLPDAALVAGSRRAVEELAARSIGSRAA